MKRGIEARVADVRRLLAAARIVHRDRALVAPEIAHDTGLTLPGVELGFASLEREATDAELLALVSAAAPAEHVHVVLSANVFVAALRAIAIARAAADRVTVRPSPRDPVLARALVEVARDDAITLIEERDVATVGADEIHVYGTTRTIAAVRSRARAGVVVRGHGPGMGAAIITAAANLTAAAEQLAADVVPFDQRGCLSPRIALVEGDEGRARSFAHALDERLGEWGRRVPRGAIFDGERAEATRWRETMAFAGQLWQRDHHAVALLPSGAPVAIPPAGRHVQVTAEPSVAAVGARVATVARFLVAVGTDDPGRAAAVLPPHARVSPLGRMQRPSFDGPVDRR
jgi:Acyl-CoA reductase (LuxC)